MLATIPSTNVTNIIQVQSTQLENYGYYGIYWSSRSARSRHSDLSWFDSVAPVLVAGIALILGVDRILDMCRTTVNVCGDCAACIVMNLFNRESSEPKL